MAASVLLDTLTIVQPALVSAVRYSAINSALVRPSDGGYHLRIVSLAITFGWLGPSGVTHSYIGWFHRPAAPWAAAESRLLDLVEQPPAGICSRASRKERRKVMIKPDAALSVLRGHQWIHNFPWHHLETLASLAEEVHFAPGDTIFRQGELSDIFYMITGGTVTLEAVMDGMPIALQSVHQGEEIGWSALMDGGVRHFTAKAATEVYALAYLVQNCAKPASGIHNSGTY